MKGFKDTFLEPVYLLDLDIKKNIVVDCHKNKSENYLDLLISSRLILEYLPKEVKIFHYRVREDSIFDERKVVEIQTKISNLELGEFLLNMGVKTEHIPKKYKSNKRNFYFLQAALKI